MTGTAPVAAMLAAAAAGNGRPSPHAEYHMTRPGRRPSADDRESRPLVSFGRPATVTPNACPDEAAVVGACAASLGRSAAAAAPTPAAARASRRAAAVPRRRIREG